MNYNASGSLAPHEILTNPLASRELVACFEKDMVHVGDVAGVTTFDTGEVMVQGKITEQAWADGESSLYGQAGPKLTITAGDLARVVIEGNPREVRVGGDASVLVFGFPANVVVEGNGVLTIIDTAHDGRVPVVHFKDLGSVRILSPGDQATPPTDEFRYELNKLFPEGAANPRYLGLVALLEQSDDRFLSRPEEF